MTDLADPLLQSSGDSARHGEGSSWWTRCCNYPEPTSDRDTFLDNFKGMAALCIVFMHLGLTGMFVCGMGDFVDTSSGKLLFGGTAVVTIFGMPFFCFISGYLSSADLNKARRKNLLRYAVIWVIQHALFFFLLGGFAQEQMYTNRWEDEHPDLSAANKLLKAAGKPTLSPPGLLPFHIFREVGLDWYLWCIIIWRVFLPLLDRLRKPLLISVVMSLVMMFTDSSASTYSNAPFGFLPYFLLGYQMKGKKEKIESIRENKMYKWSYILFVLIAMAWSFLDVDRCSQYIYGGIGCLYGGALADDADIVQTMRSFNVTEAMSHPTAVPDHFCQTGQGVLLTLLFYAVSIGSIFGCMTLVPQERTYLLTRAGRDAIYIYLGQVWILTLLTGVGFALLLDHVVLPQAVGLAIGIVATVGSWALLVQPCVKCLCSPCIEPKVDEGHCAIALP